MPRLKPDANPTSLIHGRTRTYRHNDGHATAGGYRSMSYDATICIYSQGGIFFHWYDKLTCIITREEALYLLTTRDEYGEREWELYR